MIKDWNPAEKTLEELVMRLDDGDNQDVFEEIYKRITGLLHATDKLFEAASQIKRQMEGKAKR